MPEIRPVSGDCVWHGRDMADSARWQRTLSPAQLADIDDSLRGVLAAAKARGLRWEEMTAADFPLPSFAPLAADIRAELEDGCGLTLLRGLDPSRYAMDELKLLYAGLCRHIGSLVYSNRAGEMMREIRDVTRDDERADGRSVGERYGALPDAGRPGAFLSSYARTLTSQLLRFHTDRCDVVALFCIRQAQAGGLSQLCSSPAVHNAMLRRRPELCAALYEPVWRSRFGEEDSTDDSSYPLPVWGVRGGKFTSHYSRTFIEVAQRRPEVPRLSAAQAEAIDLLHELAEELSFEMSFRPGDIQFVNNHVIYHARRAFEDGTDGGRLLLRLWMAVPNSRALPQGHEILWRTIDAGALRGGIGQTQTTPVG
ncbi:MAG: TauD/TfdA family dioxygenase [Alphaproteobacteria bacterium]|nr:TauD/TfdA family dioxygenase [Alphaproteobacteria bacterium]MBV9968081.1 TauD/TfdA family dioxygenase [Alphaproteobacteria bacterium]